jgi:uncharacterized protein YjdB/sugar lactone lactonase YvrE
VIANAVPIEDVALNKSTLYLPKGAEETLTATVTPSNASDKNRQWTSSNPLIVSVDEDGKVKGLDTGGPVTITVTAGDKTATCTVTVTPTAVPVTGIALDKNTLSLVGIGDAQTLTATVTPPDATDKTVTWTSANPLIVSVTNDGTVTGVAVGGPVNITAKAGDQTVTCAVTVVPIVAESISLNKPSLELKVNEEETLEVTILPANATNQTAIWTSRDPAAVSVTNGKVKALKAGGSAIITAMLDGKTATCTVTVKNRVLTVSTLAGSILGTDNGTGDQAQFNMPSGLAVDAQGNIFVADKGNSLIRKITPAGVVTTLPFGWGTSGKLEGELRNPNDVAVDAQGVIYVAENNNNRISKLVNETTMTIFAGDPGTPGDPTDGFGDNYQGVTPPNAGFADSPTSPTKFYDPRGIAVDAAGNVYVADRLNYKIRKITTDGTVSTVAGTTRWYLDGPKSIAQFKAVRSVAVDAAGILYVVGENENVVRRVATDGRVTTLAGTSEYGYRDGQVTIAPDLTGAQFQGPMSGVAVDAAGNVYVVEMEQSRIRKISTDGTVSTLVGSAGTGYVDGSGDVAKFNNPMGIWVNAEGTLLYVADSRNHRIRKITIE